MTSEFTDCCNRYYELIQLHKHRIQTLESKLSDVPLYSGQTKLSEIDSIISYYRDLHADKDKLTKTEKDIADTAAIILMIMKHFEIPPSTILTGAIPGEAEYEIYADEANELHITKTKHLAPVESKANIIEIKTSFWIDEDD